MFSGIFLLLTHCYSWSTGLSAAPARSPCHVWCLLRVPQLLGAAGIAPPCSTHGFLSWMALAAWLLSGPHFYLVSWLACPGKLPSPALLVKLSGWPAFPFPSLFSPSHTWCLLAPTVYLSSSLCLPLMS